ncbi:MAG: hypothetical protein ABSF44_10885 [Candidatus Bathyarchaeia archaeon]|jgi:hypothetical protein
MKTDRPDGLFSQSSLGIVLAEKGMSKERELQMHVNRLKTVSEYKFPQKFFSKNVKATYWISILYEHLRERGTQKSFENPNWHATHQNFNYYIPEESTFPSRIRRQIPDTSGLQKWRNRQIINDKVAPYKRYPLIDDYCPYCTGETGATPTGTAWYIKLPEKRDDPCANCPIYNELQEERERLAQN